MNYIGSKNKLSDFIISKIENLAGPLRDKTFAELFAGTGIISRILKNRVKKIIVNDFEYYSYVLLRNYIGNNEKFDSVKLFNELNSLHGRKGFIFNQYCADGKKGRNYFTNSNGKKIDAIRLKIQKLFDEGAINEDTYYFVVASLLKSADRIANTASVYGAYLKHIKRSASKNLILLPEEFEESDKKHSVHNQDANTLIKNIQGDILYLDPPYNNRQYGANYHLLNTIAEYKTFEPRGKTGLPDYKRSKYCYKREAEDVFTDLIDKSDFEFIFVSYNNEGILSKEKVKSILGGFGKYKLFTRSGYQRFKADRDINRKYSSNNTTEYLHTLIKK